MRLLIKNIRVIDPAQQIDEITNLYIARGKIAGIGTDTPEGFIADSVIDGTDKWVLPGLVDLQARLAEPGSQYEGSIASETKAAVAGGITTICCPPDTNPVNDCQSVTELIQRRARQAATAFVLPIGAITQQLQGKLLANMASLKNAGCIALSQANQPIQNPLTLKNAMSYAACNDILLMLRCEDQTLKNNGVAHSGAVSSRLGLAEITPSAETAALARDLILVEETGVKAHFSLISTAQSVAMIQAAKKRGLPITCDVAIHQLHLTEYDVMDFDSLFHVTPPLRSKEDMQALRMGLKMGIIDAIVSDHTPLDRDNKLLPFGESAAGMSGLETLLPLTLKLVEEGVLELSDAIAKLTSSPANIIDIANGSLTIGQSADFTIYNPDNYWTLNRNELVSQGDNSAFDGWEFSGQVEATYFQGRPVYRNNPV
jgi:dihydroorotase